MPEYEAAGEAAREEAAREAAGRWHALAAGPQGADMVLLDGFHALKHALRFGADVPLAVAEDRPEALALAAELAPDLAPRLAGLLVPVPPALYRSLVPRPHPTGVAARAARPPAAGFTGPRTSPLLVLDEPRNLGNTGAVIRLAAGFGASGVVTTGALDPWHPAAVRAGAGLHFALPVARRAVPGLPAGPLWAFDAEGEDLRGLRVPDDALLAFGSERHGLTAAVRERADRLVALPMRPQVSSYNLATSVGMALYHWSLGTGRP